MLELLELGIIFNHRIVLLILMMLLLVMLLIGLLILKVRDSWVTLSAQLSSFQKGFW